MVLVSLYAAERLILRHRFAAAAPIGLTMILAVAVFSLGTPVPYFEQHPGLPLACMILLFFAAVLLGLPVSFAMLLSPLVYLQATDTAPPVAVPQNMVDGTSNFILLALPFFLFAGLILEQGGIGVRLVAFALALVGRLKGGLLQVIVVTIYLVSGISGSKIADVAAVGSVIRDELRKQRYRLEEGAAVLAASAAMAETIPPSIAMLVLGSVTSVSIGTLFIAGLLPAAVIASWLGEHSPRHAYGMSAYTGFCRISDLISERSMSAAHRGTHWWLPNGMKPTPGPTVCAPLIAAFMRYT